MLLDYLLLNIYIFYMEKMTAKKAAFDDMRKAGIDTSVFGHEEELTNGIKYDGRQNNGGYHPKKKIEISETQLRNMIMEAVKKVIGELYE